jgi:tRNA-2-methylthio-N6-dimethylallyladenosine synthase
MLKAMNRGYTVGEYLEFIDRARARLDEPAKGRSLMIAGDIIAGFCGETEEDHQATADLLRRARYKNCFIFKYSPRPGTTAFDRLPDDVPEADKRRRVNELLALQQQISDEVSRTQVGSTLDVFVQGVSARQRKKEAAKDDARSTRDGGAPIALTISARAAHPNDATDGEQADACATHASHIEPTESAASDGPQQLSGRTDGDLIVVFDAPAGRSAADLIGRIVPVRIESVRHLTLFGHMADLAAQTGSGPAVQP